MRKIDLIFSAVAMTAMILTSFLGSSCSENAEAGKKVTIGNQIWMVQNLNVDKFRNGDPIPEAKTDEEWKKASENEQPAWCYYDNDPANGSKYGKLYNWYAVNDSRGLAPARWHLPNYFEWNTLKNNLGYDAGKKMKSTSGWIENGNGTNESGFSGLPGGYRKSDGTFRRIGVQGSWWSSSYNNIAWYRYLDYLNSIVLRDFSASKGIGQSVRCLRD